MLRVLAQRKILFVRMGRSPYLCAVVEGGFL